MPEQVSGLRCALEDVGRAPAGGGLLATFVLRNVGTKPVFIYERWNSWGAYQWRFELEDAQGHTLVAKNPQTGWDKNAPTALAIAPGGELKLRASIAQQTTAGEQGMSYFVAAGAIPFPVRLRGVFDGRISGPPEAEVDGLGGHFSSSELWASVIATPWIEVR